MIRPLTDVRQTARQTADRPALRFERRSVDRWSVRAHATAFRIGGQCFGQYCHLGVVDYCDDGLGALSDEAIEPGALVSVSFQSPGYGSKRGTVLRCVPCGHGYRVAIQFAARMAA
ncbi:MAG: hypothetical protein L0Y44_08680 [Phycisphaerales bacterium]|nr:hypothetical protein [Phycisphaerales bacterium]MCI0630711.1 hypothetical protein [Phycisphaerales bacterium]MCI0677325.1 hypothetical protein [Phycisphaerales bacterium]